MLRQWWANPRTAPRVALGVILLGGVLAGIGTFFRDAISGQNDEWTYLLDTAGLLIAVFGAGLDFRATARIAEFTPGSGNRRAILQVLAGAICALGGCILLGWVATSGTPAVIRGLLSGVMTAGFGLGFAGLLHIGWFSGADRLGRRIEQRIDEDW
jgi:hypothetical protein